MHVCFEAYSHVSFVTLQIVNLKYKSRRFAKSLKSRLLFFSPFPLITVVEQPPLISLSYLLELIPRPARSCEDPPLYLRLRMGKPLNKPIPKSTPLMSYGKKKMRPEYWFSVPKNRVDELYKFIQGWVPHLYGELDEEKVSLPYLFLFFNTVQARNFDVLKIRLLSNYWMCRTTGSVCIF